MNKKSDQKQIKEKNKSKTVAAHSFDGKLVKTELFGIGITNEPESVILEYIAGFIQNTSRNGYIVTPNPEMIVTAQRSKGFARALNNAEIALCDGIGLFFTAFFLGKKIVERIPGSDFLVRLCAMTSNRPITIGFLGGRGGVAKMTAECLLEVLPGLKVVFIGEEWIENQIHDPIDILFVAFGHPKQELWMAEHIDKIPVRMMMGVGGAFDYLSGYVQRAPWLIRFIGFEWLYRLIKQPWRWRRQLSLIAFIFLFFKEKYKK